MSQFPPCNLLTLSMIRIIFLCQNLIIPPIDNQFVFCKHNQIELRGQNNRQNLIA